MNMLVVVLLSLSLGYSFCQQFLGSFPTSSPAFLTLYPNGGNSSITYDLLLSSFSPVPFATDSVSIVKDIGQYLDQIQDVKPKILTTMTTWPNEVSGVPEVVFGRRMVAIPDGFLLPLNTDGALKLVDVDQDPTLKPYQITDDFTGQWFYHRVKWQDMDGDGDMDAVTCRAKEPIIGTQDSELLWLENPDGNLEAIWKPHVLDHGPDIFFELLTLNSTSGPLDCIIVTQFFTQKLAIYWTLDPSKRWANTSMVRSRVIDDTIGAVFDVKVKDINMDGNLDLLVTNNGNNGSVFVYEIPQDFRSGQFVRHVISTGYRPGHEAKGRGAPGSAFPIDKSNGKPIILLSADDEGQAYLLSPNSNEPTDWGYKQTPLLDKKDGTVGQPAVADVDGDGNPEIFVPQYTEKLVFVWRLNSDNSV